MIRVETLIQWLARLAPNGDVYIDDGGLTVRSYQDPNAYLEVGGEPEDDEEE